MTAARPSLPDRLPPPVRVEDAAGLREMLSYLADQEVVAIDTEADSFFHYQESVCLVQVSAGGRDFVVDPLKRFDLDGLGDLLADPARVKVFHDGEYDVLIMKRQYGFSFASLFDTRVAASALGSSSPGLASVLKEHFGVELDKSMQRSDWSARPLSAKQVAYARLDTHYLERLRERQLEALDARGRLLVVEGECRRLEALPVPDRSFDPNGFARLKGARRLGPQALSRLRELFITRDELARQRDVPPFKVLGNSELLRIAEDDARDVAGLARIRGLSPKIVQRVGEDLVRALERAERVGPLERLPRLAKRDGTDDLDELQVELHERLKAFRKERAVAMDMDASLVLNRHVLLALARSAPRTRRELERVEGIVAWQLVELGEGLLACIDAFHRDVESGAFQPRRRRR